MTDYQLWLIEHGKCPWCRGYGKRLIDRKRDNITGMAVNGPTRCLDCKGSGEVADKDIPVD